MADGRSSSRLPPRMIAASTAVALIAAIGTYRVLDAGAGGEGPGPAAPRGEAPAGAPVGAPVGTDLSGMSFQGLGGATTELSELAGRPVVLNFFASWCSLCRVEMPAFERVHEDLGEEVAFVGLAVRDRPEDIRAFLGATGVTYRVGRDVDDRVMAATGLLGALPATVLLDDKGRLVEAHRGQLGEQGLRDLLAEHFGVSA